MPPLAPSGKQRLIRRKDHQPVCADEGAAPLQGHPFQLNDRTPPLHSSADVPGDPVPFAAHRHRQSLAFSSPSSSLDSTSPGSSLLATSSELSPPGGGGGPATWPPLQSSREAVINRPSRLSSSSHSSSSSSSPCKQVVTRHCHLNNYSYKRPFPLLSACILAIFLISFGPFDFVTAVAGQDVSNQIRRQYWLMCPSSGGNATINVTCMGSQPVPMNRVGPGEVIEGQAKTGRGPIIRIVELRAHLISDQKAWSGFGPRSCLWTRELNKTTGEIAMASLGSLPVVVDPQDNVSDMLMKNCQAQTYCLSTDSKNINARQFSETFKAIPEAGDVFHDQDKQMKVPVVLELGYMCTANPSPVGAPNEMCPTSAKNASKIDVPVVESGETTTTWLWSPNYQREDTPSQTSCECILRSSSPSVNVTLVAYHVRSWNSKTSGFRNVINQRVLTMYNDECTENSFEKNKDPCIPALCRKSTADAESGGTSLEVRLSSECLFSGPPEEREFYMRRVWFAIETTYRPDGEQFIMRRHRRRRRSSHRRRRLVRKRREADGEEEVEPEGEEGIEGEEGGESPTEAEGTDAGAEDSNAGGDNGEGDAAEPTAEAETSNGGADAGGESDGAEATDETPTDAPVDGPEATEAPETEVEEDATTPEPTPEPAAGGGSDYETDNEGEAPEPAQTPAPKAPQSSSKPTVTITCYNYARTSSNGPMRGAAPSLLATPSPSPSGGLVALLFQTAAIVLQTAPILIFAVMAHLFC